MTSKEPSRLQTLSEKKNEIVYDNCRYFCGNIVYEEEDVKEAIKKLKKKFYFENSVGALVPNWETNKIIEEIFGKRLVEK